MTKLDTLTLRVCNPVKQKHFYCDILGMKDLGDGKIGYNPQEAGLRFLEATHPYTPQSSDLYWKIAIAIPNIELAVKQLRDKGVEVTQPKQFRDIGYLAKAIDPEGFTIELIEHWFQGDRPKGTYNEALLGGEPCINLLTLRTADIKAIEPDVLRWGMTPLSIQPVEPYGFTLYFYAFTNERPPKPDLRAIENRTWVYQRPYSVLEIQHVYDLDIETHPDQKTAGYEGIYISSSKSEITSKRLRISSISID